VLVLGGGYIAVELAQMLNRLGTRVTLLQRSGHLLSAQPAYLGNLLADTLRAEGVEVVCGVTRADLGSDAQGVTARAETAEGAREFRAEKVFLARGRRGQTHDIGLAALGIETNARGFIRVDAQLQTSCAGVYAAGDVLGGHMLVYTASEEGERVAAQLCGETPAAPDPADIPWVVFTDPQVAGVGWSEAELEARGLKYETAELPVNRWPRFSTANETRGFLRLFRDPETDTLFGARAICPEAGDLMSELRLIRHHRIPLREVANALVPYLTLTEGIQRCASRFY
jgi:mercuric reductase